MNSLALRAVAIALSGVTFYVTISIGPGRFTLSAGTDGKVKVSAAVVSAGGARAQGVSGCLVGCSDADALKSVDKLTLAEGPARLRMSRDSAGHAEATVDLAAVVRNKSRSAAVEFGFQKTISQAEVGVAGLHSPTSHQRAAGALVRGAFQPAPAQVVASPAWAAQRQNNKAAVQLLESLQSGRPAAAVNVPGSSAVTIQPSPLITSALGGRSLTVVLGDAKHPGLTTYTRQSNSLLDRHSTR